MKKVLIYGYGKSGKAVEKVLQQKKIEYVIYDDNLKVTGGCYLAKLTKQNMVQFDTVVLSPGVSIFQPMVVYAKKKGIKVMSELEFASHYIHVPMIAVTGTNGKTTTVTLIKDLLQRAGKKVEVVGNIGTPLCDVIDQVYDYLVVEVSSFQLEAIDKFCPLIAVVLNIDHDHLDRHKSFENYKLAKMSIFRNNNKSTYAVVNGADEHIECRHLYNVIKFDKHYAGSHAYLKDNHIFRGASEIVDMEETRLLYGNVDNALAMICVADILHIEDKVVKDTLLSYEPLPHRLQCIAQIDEVKYYDDSKATNLHAVKVALTNFDHSVILLLGGKAKGLDLKKFVTSLPKSVYLVVAFGESGEEIAKLLKKYSKIPSYYYPTLKQATLYAKSQARKGDIVLLSPGGSSFDEFSSYTERGECWKRYIVGDGYGNKT